MWQINLCYAAAHEKKMLCTHVHVCVRVFAGAFGWCADWSTLYAVMALYSCACACAVRQKRDERIKHALAVAHACHTKCDIVKRVVYLSLFSAFRLCRCEYSGCECCPRVRVGLALLGNRQQ